MCRPSWNPRAPLLVAIDPLDGSSNIDTNASIGTIFSILPVSPGAKSYDNCAAFLQPGERQLAAGYVDLRAADRARAHHRGRHARLHSRSSQRLTSCSAREGVRVPRRRANSPSTRRTIGTGTSPSASMSTTASRVAEGPRGDGLNMRWIASMVAEAHRVLARGRHLHVSRRPPQWLIGTGGCGSIYEASPVAWLMEQAGAAAPTGTARILEITARQGLHQRVPLIFGSREEVDRLNRYHRDPSPRRRTLAAFRPARPVPELMPCRHSIPSFRSPARPARARLRCAERSSTSSAARRSRPPSSKATPSITMTASTCDA